MLVLLVLTHLAQAWHRRTDHLREETGAGVAEYMVLVVMAIVVVMAMTVVLKKMGLDVLDWARTQMGI